MQMNVRGWSLLFVLSMLWGGTFFFTAVAVREIPPLTLVWIRVSIASIILYVYVRVNLDGLPKEMRALRALFTMGVLNVVIPFSLFFWAQTRISGSLASILNAATPIFSILAAHALLADERLTVRKSVGVFLGLIGVVILLGGNLLAGVSASTAGVVACLCAAAFQGLAVTYGRRFRTMGLSGATVALGQLAAATMTLLPVAIIVDQPWQLPVPGMAAMAASLALAVFSTALAYVIFFHLLASTGAVNASLVTLLIPLSATLLGMTFLDEMLEARHILGMGFIAVGLMAVDGRPIAWLARKTRRGRSRLSG